MTDAEFLKSLELQLQGKLSDQDINDALSYYSELIDENSLSPDLTPEKAANEILKAQGIEAIAARHTIKSG